MRFQVLGPLEIWTGEDWTSIGAPKWRSLLAALLVDAGQVVSTDRLITEIWSDEPPRGATNLVSIYAHNLRKKLGSDGDQVQLTLTVNSAGNVLGSQGLEAVGIQSTLQDRLQIWPILIATHSPP